MRKRNGIRNSKSQILFLNVSEAGLRSIIHHLNSNELPLSLTMAERTLEQREETIIL